MKLLIGMEGYTHSTLIECSDEVGNKINSYLDAYIHSDMYQECWGADDLVAYIQREISSTPELSIEILDIYSDMYEGKYEKIFI